MWDINVFIMQIDYMKISCKENVHICHTNFVKKMEQNLHETTSWWKTYGNNCFPRTLKFKMLHSFSKIQLNVISYIDRSRESM
jgi:hypothetical protein